VGLCSQHALIVLDALKRRGIVARLVLLDGHVVASAQVDDERWWVLDPDYGVVIPQSIEQIQEAPESVRPFYRAAGHSEKVIDLLVQLYGPEGNMVLDGVGDPRRPAYMLRAVFEKVAYFLKWAIPLALGLVSCRRQTGNLLRRRPWGTSAPRRPTP
jgi:hypothetical protein